jgi:ferredoxin-NADP reductase/ferredoxin
MTTSGETADAAVAAGLPFWVLLWIAGADDNVELGEVEVFQRMLERRSWCKSALARRLLPQALEAYPGLWQAFAKKTVTRELSPVERGLQASARLTDEADFALFKKDLETLAEALARATGGFLGLGSISPEEEAALRDLRELSARVRHGVAQPPPPKPAQAARAADDEAGEGEAPADGPRTVVDLKPIVPRAVQQKWTRGRIRLCVVETVQETHDVKTFRFVGEPRVEFAYLPGQFITLDLTIGGVPVKRSYSISSSPTRQGTLEITVKRVPGGLVSNWLHDNVKPGFRVNVSGPGGKFSCLPEAPPRMVLLSAGSGITPAMSMARALFDQRAPSDVVFLHSARSLNDVPFLAELRAMEQRWPGFKVGLVLTRPAPEDGWTGHSGRLAPRMVLDLVPGYRQRTVFACGPTPFMDHARGVMTELGFPLHNFHMESFGGAKGAEEKKSARPASIAELLPKPSAVPARRPVTLGAGQAPAASAGKSSSPGGAGAAGAAKLTKVVFAKAGREVAHDGGTPILELAERLGVNIPSACRAGVCGTCAVQVSSGEVQMECTDGLSAADRKAGKVLTCVGKPVGAVVVEA